MEKSLAPQKHTPEMKNMEISPKSPFFISEIPKFQATIF